MTKYFIPPGDDYTPKVPGVWDLIKYLVDRVKEARDAGGPIFPVLVVGDQGVGKSRLLAALAVELRRAGFDVYYDLALPKPREEPYDYVILDDLAALVTSWEWLTKAGRTLKKIEILIRNLGRWGYAVAAPRASDVIKNFREKSYMLVLVPRSELKHEYNISTNCDVVALYLKYASAVEYMLYYQLYIRPLRGRRYCIKWDEFPWYGDAKWRHEYERVQAKRQELVARLLDELRGEKDQAAAARNCAGELARAIYRATGAATPGEALLRLLEMPDVYITKPRSRRRLEEIKANALPLAERLGPEAAAKVAELLAAGKAVVAVRTRSALAYSPREFACKKATGYAEGRAYPFTLDEVIAALLIHQPA